MVKKQLFLNAFLLTATTFFIKICTTIFKIYLSNKLTSKGMGLYQLLITFFGFAISLSCAGVQISVTKLLSQKSANKTGVMKIAIRHVLYVSVIVILIGTIFSETISVYFLKNPFSVYSLRILLPSLIPIAISCCIKGYFTAENKIYLVSISQIIEDCLKISLIVIIFNKFMFKRTEYMCFIVCIAILLSEISSCMFLTVSYVKNKGNSTPKYNLQNINKEFYYMIATLGFGSIISSFMHTAENILIPIQLEKYGYNTEIALSHYGLIKGMAIPLLCFPLVLISTISSLLLPEITRLYSSGNKNRAGCVISRVIKVVFTASVFIMGIFLMYSDHIGILVYKNNIVGKYLFYLAFFIPFMYLDGLLFSFLTALGLSKKVFKITVIDAFIRVILTFFTVQKYGVNGILFVMYISNLFTPICAFICLTYKVKTEVKMGDIIIPFIVLFLSLKIYKYFYIKNANLFIEILTGIIIIFVIYLSILTVIFLCKSMYKKIRT